MNSSSNSLAGKSSSSSATHAVNQQYPPQASPSFESSRRVISNTPTSTPRNNQSQRKQHKPKRRPRLVDEDAMAESRVLRNAGGRRGQTSITHLMNFALPPRPQYTPRNPRRHYSYHTVDKARYVHANYRFIVKPDGDYRAQAVDADVYLDWDSILQILVSAQSQASTCPICLSPPVATRMAKCGHLFCLPCLIRYMHSTDDSNPVPEKRARWKKCPICYDPIYISEVRPVRWYYGQEQPPPHEGEDVVLRLIERQPGNTLALPRDGADVISATGEDVPWFFAAEVADFARVMKGGQEYMTQQFDEEVRALELQEKDDELMFGEENLWTQKAIGNINDAKQKLASIGDAPTSAKQPTEPKPKRPTIQFNPEDDIPERYTINHAAKSGLSASTLTHLEPDLIQETETIAKSPSTLTTHTSDTKHKHRHARGNSGAHPAHTPYFFYQALLHYYLAPLDIRILKEAFGSFESFPSTLLPRVDHVSSGHVVDDDLRKKAKYLSHLPYGCEVCFLECDWTDVVSPDILARFNSDIERRRKRNKEKELKEEKDRVRAEREEDDKRWASARRKRSSITGESINQFTNDPSLIEAINISNGESSTNFSSASPPWASKQGSTFATLASPGSSPVATSTTVWGTRVVAPSSPELVAQHIDPGDDGWLHDWEKELQAENEALAAEVQAASLDEGGSITTTSKGKKKKAKKITLMSTTARRTA